MKTFLLLAFTITIGTMGSTLPTHAQTSISYSYDAAGNRTSRKVITLKSAPEKVADSTGAIKNNEAFEENLGEQKISIFPNPTQGELNVEISGYDQDAPSAVYLYTLSGTLLLNKTLTGNSVRLDLSGYPIGTYVLKVMPGSKMSEWKVVKQ